jgi:Ca2+-transporting ATPase
VVRNSYVWGALGLCTALLLAAVYVPAVAEVMSLAAPNPAGWALVVAASLVPLAAGQLALAVRARL